MKPTAIHAAEHPESAYEPDRRLAGLCRAHLDAWRAERALYGSRPDDLLSPRYAAFLDDWLAAQDALHETFDELLRELNRRALGPGVHAWTLGGACFRYDGRRRGLKLAESDAGGPGR